MSKLAPVKGSVNIRRESRSGQFIGRAEDGMAIAKPAFKPDSFTVEKLHKVIRAVRDREPAASSG